MRAKVPPLIWLLLFGAAMWFVAKSPYAFPVRVSYALVLAIAFGLVGAWCGAAGIRSFNKASTTFHPHKLEEASTLVTTGIYQKTRNPMYLGLLLMLTGWGVWLGSLANIALLVLFVVVMTELQIKPEENVLRKLFGQDYEDYRQRDRRWI